MPRWSLGLFALCWLLVPAATRGEPPLNLKDPPSGTFVDEWYVVLLQGGKAGHMHTTIHRDGDRITTRTDMTIAMRRDRDQVQVRVELTNRERLDGTPVGFDQSLHLGGPPLRTQGKIRNGKVLLRDSQFGKTTEREYPFDARARLTWGSLLEQDQHGLKPGTKYTIYTYDASVRPDAAIPTRVEVIGPEKIELPSGAVTATRVRQVLELRPSSTEAGPGSSESTGAKGMVAAQFAELVSESWVDEQGTPLRLETQFGGMFKLSLLKSTREAALAGDQPPELFVSTLIEARGRLDPNAARVRYTLHTKDGGPLPEFPNTVMQRFERLDAGRGRLTVERRAWMTDKSAAVGRELPPDERTRMTQASIIADANDPKIREITRQAVGDATDPAQQLDRLRRFVSRYVKDKNLSVGFATATEVAKSCEGDCTEHAVLLAAMARAAGIPARGVGGIVLVPGSPSSKPVFGFHMWTQVYVRGGWQEIDGALAQTECDATHIALSIMDLNESGWSDAALQMIPVLGNLELTID